MEELRQRFREMKGRIEEELKGVCMKEWAE
jgi:hypothetical protein